MKKFGFLVLAFITCLIITGCGCEKNKYTVTFDSTGGSLVDSVEVKKGDVVSKPIAPTKEGYTFLGWYLDETQYDFSSKVNKDITLKAKWDEGTNAADTFTVTFDSNGGTVVSNKKVKNGEKVSEPTTTREGYTFLGWYLGDTKYDFSKEVTSNLTLVAKWENNSNSVTVTKYTVTFDSNGGSVVANKIVEKGKNVSKPSNPTREGYSFLGWYLGDTEYNFNTKVTNNIKLVAKWEKVATIAYVVEPVENSIIGQVKIFVTKNGVKIAGTVDMTSTSGVTKTIDIPATGKTVQEGTYTSIANPKEK